MVIISESEQRKKRHYGKTQLRFATTYILITSAFLVFLNIYCFKTSQKIFYKSKEFSMLEKAQFAAAEISNADVVNSSTVSRVLSDIDSLKASRIIVTSHTGKILYDSLGIERVGSYALFPEIVSCLKWNKVFSWHYHDSTMISRAATPIVSYGTLIGCVYMMEYDTTQGVLIDSLQKNILIITAALELVVLIFSLVFSDVFSKRMRRILASIRIIRDGDYSHKVFMGGNDELTYLGNEFNDLADRLQDSERTQRQFVSDASHELKTPLASIKLLSDSILQNEMDVETIREFVTDIGDEADRLTRMSAKLLSLTKVDAKYGEGCEIAYMKPTIERVIRMLTGIAAKNGITLHTDFSDDCPILVIEDDLYQIAFNLVENGIKYNTPGGHLYVSLYREADTGVLKVSDTGVGISEDALAHIFERFYRVDKARSRQTGGSGLGLAIVREMVLRNNGIINASSSEGKGTTFTVSFPAFDTEEEPQ